MKKITKVFILLAIIFTLTSCNTINKDTPYCLREQTDRVEGNPYDGLVNTLTSNDSIYVVKIEDYISKDYNDNSLLTLLEVKIESSLDAKSEDVQQLVFPVGCYYDEVNEEHVTSYAVHNGVQGHLLIGEYYLVQINTGVFEDLTVYRFHHLEKYRSLKSVSNQNDEINNIVEEYMSAIEVRDK